MPLRRTKRSNGRPRPRWKDGSHVHVENTHANKSRCNEAALEPNRRTEPLVTVPQLLKRSDENNVSTRDRLARTGADARIKESAAMGEVRLALRPYGRQSKLGFLHCPITWDSVKSPARPRDSAARKRRGERMIREGRSRTGAVILLALVAGVSIATATEIEPGIYRVDGIDGIVCNSIGNIQPISSGFTSRRK